MAPEAWERVAGIEHPGLRAHLAGYADPESHDLAFCGHDPDSHDPDGSDEDGADLVVRWAGAVDRYEVDVVRVRPRAAVRA
ncbi:hypothetical protein AB0D08_30145 [Kitasatospora sp. NPDC048540]|uniref:hypothetical protein n=1 Tax=Kitasatospora sp. NPDC048540 TaxID=3155634 RepID=UPI00340F8F5C